QTVTEDQVLGMKIMTQGYTCRFAPTASASETVSRLSGELRRRIRISAGNFQSLFLVPAILNPARGPVCFSFISHKLMRWLVPFFLVAMLIANSLLAGLSGYSATLMFQGLFYASGLVAACLPKLTGALKFLAIPKYFLAMNLAILIGFARFITRNQKVAWAKTRRR
ncbi:MAG: glycosyltransferase family 2 protein, partial [Planctomycetes bacterium]|nr:glycosyltransferase family 2 protein [Planctomycetota bacterium]